MAFTAPVSTPGSTTGPSGWSDCRPRPRWVGRDVVVEDRGCGDLSGRLTTGGRGQRLATGEGHQRPRQRRVGRQQATQRRQRSATGGLDAGDNTGHRSGGSRHRRRIGGAVTTAAGAAMASAATDFALAGATAAGAAAAGVGTFAAGTGRGGSPTRSRRTRHRNSPARPPAHRDGLADLESAFTDGAVTTGVAPPLLLRFVAALAVPAVCDEVPRARRGATGRLRRVTAAIVGRAGSVVRERNCHPVEGSDTDAQSDGRATYAAHKGSSTHCSLSPIVVTNRISIGSAVRARSEIQQIER